MGLLAIANGWVQARGVCCIWGGQVLGLGVLDVQIEWFVLFWHFPQGLRRALRAQGYRI